MRETQRDGELQYQVTDAANYAPLPRKERFSETLESRDNA